MLKKFGINKNYDLVHFLFNFKICPDFYLSDVIFKRP